MMSNVGRTDRIIRIVAGIILIALAATGTIGYWGYIGVVPLATGLIGWCPAYLPFGIKTCRTRTK
ncbi:MAG: YgaP family membrane protein [Burkholderiales bacterium]